MRTEWCHGIRRHQLVRLLRVHREHRASPSHCRRGAGVGCPHAEDSRAGQPPLLLGNGRLGRTGLARRPEPRHPHRRRHRDCVVQRRSSLRRSRHRAAGTGLGAAQSRVAAPHLRRRRHCHGNPRLGRPQRHAVPRGGRARTRDRIGRTRDDRPDRRGVRRSRRLTGRSRDRHPRDPRHRADVRRSTGCLRRPHLDAIDRELRRHHGQGLQRQRVHRLVGRIGGAGVVEERHRIRSATRRALRCPTRRDREASSR